ncbi:hypothetical protein [Terriglobus aquaticus]|uniref:Uncharacterized protein n=1 Tax=Terriglobus aquaticus TaxID=940139 RepID=A0ABW9KNM8_9BACT|nr:hypothetical protein [Terriglobus aquaticus]
MNASKLKLKSRQFLGIGLCLGLTALFHAASAEAQLSPVHPVGQCVEYSNVPGSGQYVGHFSYFNSDSSSHVYRPDGSSNYLQPLDVTTQPLTYYPGFHPDALTVLVPFGTAETWHLGTDEATVFSGTQASQTQAVSPTCPARLIPASLQLSQPGTYPHQYLGQVQSGPAIDADTTYVLIGVPLATANVTVSNLTYIPADSANPGQWLNPNSIYGDITVTAAAPGTTIALDVQLSVKGLPIVEGLVTVQQ